MKKMILLPFICCLLLAGQPAVAFNANWWISCEGKESGAQGIRQYQYGVKNMSGGPLNLTQLVVGTDDVNFANYTNVVNMLNWNFALGAGGVWRNAGVKTAHGGFAPLNPTADTAATVMFWDPQGIGVPVAAGGTVAFGFDNPNVSENVDWWCLPEPMVGANWASPVAGPVGVFTNGPVHGPVPEPATLGLLLIGGLALLRRRRK